MATATATSIVPTVHVLPGLARPVVAPSAPAPVAAAESGQARVQAGVAKAAAVYCCLLHCCWHALLATPAATATATVGCAATGAVVVAANAAAVASAAVGNGVAIALASCHQQDHGEPCHQQARSVACLQQYWTSHPNLTAATVVVSQLILRKMLAIVLFERVKKPQRIYDSQVVVHSQSASRLCHHLTR